MTWPSSADLVPLVRRFQRLLICGIRKSDDVNRNENVWIGLQGIGQAREAVSAFHSVGILATTSIVSANWATAFFETVAALDGVGIAEIADHGLRPCAF